LDDLTQDACPYAAHIRKANPRGDLNAVRGSAAPAILESRRIMRRGISYGDPVSPGEEAQHKTEQERGLAFVAYSSSIDNGFQGIPISEPFIPNSQSERLTYPQNG